MYIIYTAEAIYSKPTKYSMFASSNLTVIVSRPSLPRYNYSWLMVGQPSADHMPACPNSNEGNSLSTMH